MGAFLPGDEQGRVWPRFCLGQLVAVPGCVSTLEGNGQSQVWAGFLLRTGSSSSWPRFYQESDEHSQFWVAFLLRTGGRSSWPRLYQVTNSHGSWPRICSGQVVAFLGRVSTIRRTIVGLGHVFALDSQSQYWTRFYLSQEPHLQAGITG